MELPANTIMNHDNRHLGLLVRFKVLSESIDGQPSFRSTATEEQLREMNAAMDKGWRECVRMMGRAMIHYRFLKRDGKL